MTPNAPNVLDDAPNAPDARIPPEPAAGEPAVPVLRAEGLVRHFALARTRLWRPAPRLRAVDGVSLAIAAGESLGVVGESGSGKSTLARLVMALETPSAGEVEILGRNVHRLGRTALRRWRRHFQMVFQDPYGSLDPRQPVRRIVAEPLQALGETARAARDEAVAEVLLSVGLRPGDMAKYPHEFSGGQRQRIAIARALITRPALIVADEPVSALDVSVQAQVLNLMQDLRQRFHLAYLFISHDLAVVRYVSDRVAVMYRGRIVEMAPTEALYRAPAHPYALALLRRPAAAGPAMGDAELSDDMPGQAGCAYAARCPFAQARCRLEAPGLRDLGQGRQAACHFAEQIIAEGAETAHRLAEKRDRTAGPPESG